MVFNQNFFPRARTSVLTTLDRISAPVTDFIRGNPIVSTAAIGIGTTGLITGLATVAGIRRKRKKIATRKKKRKVGRKKRARKVKGARRAKKRVTHRSPRHKGHKRVSFTTASGQKVNFLVRKKKHSHRRLRRKRK